MHRHNAVDVDVLAREVSRRLCAQNDASLLNDPHSHVLRIATEVEAEWEGRARRSWTGGGQDAIPAPSALACNAVRTAVLALSQRQRQLLQLHLEGLSYRQIATTQAVPQEAVLRELVGAYCQLRRAVPDAQLEDTCS